MGLCRPTLAVVVVLVGSTVAGVAGAGTGPVLAPDSGTGASSAGSATGWSVPDSATAGGTGVDPGAPAPADGGVVETVRSTSVERTPFGGHASATGVADAIEAAPRNVTATQRLQLTPDEPGSVRVTLTYEVPDSVTSLTTTLPAGATVTDAAGFARSQGRTYEWDGETAPASVTYAVDANETEERSGPEGAAGRYLFADAGAWALVKRPQVTTQWSWRGGAPVGLTRETTTAGPGHAGEWIVYLGRVTVHERRAHGQQFRLVVPERATLAESPSAVVSALATASDQLRVGDRDGTVRAFVAPTTGVEWGVRGLQTGDADMWVRDVERLDTVENTWFHEYVHTRQDYETTAATRWTDEALATYYAGLLTVEQGRADVPALLDLLERGTAPPQSRAVLADPSSWTNSANYVKGALVAGDLDRRIRVATDSERSLASLFSWLNAHPGPVTGSALAAEVERLGGSRTRDAFVRYTTTPETPSVWSASAHREAFGTTPARLSVGFAGEVEVTGPYRNGTLDPTTTARTRGQRPSVTAFVGETVSMTGEVTNAGGVATTYGLRFYVDGAVAETAEVSVAPGETVTRTFQRTFETTGNHTLAVGSDALSVRVYNPAQASITGLAANRTSLSGPGAVELRVTVTNDHDVPARLDFTIDGPEGTAVDRTVTLAPGEQRTVTGTTRLAEPGEYTFEAGEADPVTVTVEEGGSSGFGPGPGAVAALVTVVLGTAALARRRNR